MASRIDTWVCESAPPAFFRAGEIKQSDFAKGIDHEVTLSAMVFDGQSKGFLEKMTFANGTFVVFNRRD